eukprot:scaffold6401_cov73-Isochrysis_galbana.AAC.1
MGDHSPVVLGAGRDSGKGSAPVLHHRRAPPLSGSPSSRNEWRGWGCGSEVAKGDGARAKAA